MPSPADESRLDRADLTPLARDVLDGRHDVEDVAQDVWLLLRRQPPGRVRSLAAWVKVAILHLAVRRRQRDRHRAERERIVARSERTPSVVEQLVEKSRQEFLSALVDELGDPYTEVVRLRYIEDREIEEIAGLVGRSPGTVRSQLKRGLERLRARLGERGRTGRFALLLSRLDRHGEGRRMGALPATSIAAGLLVLFTAALHPWSTTEESLDFAAVASPSSRSELADPGAIRPGRAPVPLAEAPAAAPERAAETEWLSDVEGDVLDPDGAPVPGAAVRVGSEDESDSRVAAYTDADGRYLVPAVDERLLIWAEGPGRFPSNRCFIGSRTRRSRLELRVGHAGETLVGRVLTSDGRPVPRATVTCIGSSSDPTGFTTGAQGTLELPPPPIPVVADEDGRFRLCCPPQPRLSLLVTAEGHAPLARTLAFAKEDHPELVLTLPAASALEGRLLRPEGVPAAGVLLGLAFPDPLPDREGRTDEAGRFRFETLPPGPHVLRLLEDPSGATASCFVEGELREGEQRILGDVTLDREHTIFGRALDGERPLAGWIVESDLKNSSASFEDRRRSTTGPDGEFSFPSCGSGSHALRLLAPGGGLHALVRGVRSGGDGIVLHADAAAFLPESLSGRFECDDPGLMPVFVSLKGDFLSAPHMVRVDPGSGAFSAARLPVGSYQLRAWVPEVGFLRETVNPGQERVPQRVPVPGTLEVQVRLEGVSWNGLAASIAIPALHDSVALAGNMRFQEDPEHGRFVARLFPGDYVYQVTRAGSLYESRQVNIVSGATTIDKITIREVVPMTLALDLERNLRKYEKAWLDILEDDPPRRIESWALVSQTERMMVIRVNLTRDTRELRFETNLGLAGRLQVSEQNIVAGDTLRMPVLETPAGTRER